MMFGRNDNAAARLARLFELYEQKMYRVAHAILHDEGQAEDAMMAAFEGIARSGKIPHSPESKEAERLAFASVRNAAIDQYRRNARERERTLPFAQVELPTVPDPAGEPERSVLAQAGFEALVEPLSDPDRNVLRERFANGNSVRQAACNLQISEADVRKRQQRAIARIRNSRGITNE